MLTIKLIFSLAHVKNKNKKNENINKKIHKINIKKIHKMNVNKKIQNKCK